LVPRSGLDAVERRNILPLPGLELRALGHAARNQSLSQLLRGDVYLIYECVADEFSGMPDRRSRKLMFFNSHSGGWSPNWVHSARRPLNGLLYLPRVIVMMENFVE
jgi:hypothetical protein